MSTTVRPRSIRWFYGRFSPAPWRPLLVSDPFGIGGRFTIALLIDAFWISLVTDEESLEDLITEVESVAETFAGAYALRTETALVPFVESWVSFPDHGDRTAAFGVRHRADDFEHGDQTKVLMALSDVDFAFTVKATTPHWIAALRNLGMAAANYSDDAFVFATRALESCARAVSGRTTGKLRRSDWSALAAHVRMSDDDLTDLKSAVANARHAAVHGDIQDEHLVFARANRQVPLEPARNLVRAALVTAQLAALHSGVWVQQARDARTPDSPNGWVT